MMGKRRYTAFLGILVLLAVIVLVKNKLLGMIIKEPGPRLEIVYEYKELESILLGKFTKIKGEIFNRGDERAVGNYIICYLNTEDGTRYEERSELGPIGPGDSGFFKITIDNVAPVVEVKCEAHCEKCPK